MKKILLTTDTLIEGGAELQMFLLAKFLNKEKFSPLIAISNSPNLDGFANKFADENIEVIRINTAKKHHPSWYFSLNAIIKTKNIQLLHAHIWNPASNRYAYLAAKKNSIPLITTEHDPFKLSFLKNALKKILIKNTDKIVTVSKENQKLLTALYPNQQKKITTIHNGIDLVWWQSQNLRYTPEERKKIKVEIFKANLETPICITVAALHERKGLDLLIKAIPLVIKKIPQIKFIFLGDGPEKNKLINLVKNSKIENYVEFLGKQKHVSKFLRSSDLFILPSKREAFGMAALEAIITGLPCLTANTGGLKEIIENNKNGILVEPEKTEIFAKKIIQMINLPEEEKNTMIENAKKILKEKFSAKKMAEEYEKIYHQLLKNAI